MSIFFFFFISWFKTRTGNRIWFLKVEQEKNEAYPWNIFENSCFALLPGGGAVLRWKWDIVSPSHVNSLLTPTSQRLEGYGCFKEDTRKVSSLCALRNITSHLHMKISKKYWTFVQRKIDQERKMEFWCFCQNTGDPL